jgi:multidrug efflux pump
VFSGMIGVTAFGLFFTPVFYVLVRRLAGNRRRLRQPEPAEAASTPVVHSVRELVS